MVLFTVAKENRANARLKATKIRAYPRKQCSSQSDHGEVAHSSRNAGPMKCLWHTLGII